MKTRWHFPLIDPIRSHRLKHYSDHVIEEVREFERARTRKEKEKEAADILHAAETLVRKYFRAKSFEPTRKAVIKKNRVRGYYSRRGD